MLKGSKINVVQAWHSFRLLWNLPHKAALVARLALIGSFVGGSLGLCAIAVQAQPARLPAGDPRQVPTARYGRGESVDLSLIVEEWRDRYPAIPIYACNCNADTCGDVSVWPFRDFTRYQLFVALGAFNAANNEETGFNCFDMETGERPEI